MYRIFENPYTLESELANKKQQYEEFMLSNKRRMKASHPESERLWDIALHMHEDISALTERVNFAWQDQEFDHQCAA